MRNKIQQFDLDPVESVVNENVSYPVDTLKRPSCGVEMEAVYFTEDSSQALAFFKDNPDKAGMDRLRTIVGEWHDRIASRSDGDTALRSMCWPMDVVKHKDDIGIVLPTWPLNFYFKKNGASHIVRIKGHPKFAKWFSHSLLCSKDIHREERGDFSGRLRCCMKLARAVHAIHDAGLVHGDISSESVLVDPVECEVLLTSCDGVFEPGKYVPSVVGTKGFVAPEIVATLKSSKKTHVLPNQLSDRHSLAVFVYSLLLRRSPMEGAAIWNGEDAEHDDELTFGKKALFVENPIDARNRYDWKWVVAESRKQDVKYLSPWHDLDALPYTKLGPHLSTLVKRAFVDGLHNPSARPTAAEWITAIEKTIPLKLDIPN